MLSPLKTPLVLVVIAFMFYLGLAKDITGDLGKIGQIVFSKEYHAQTKFEEDIDKQLYWCANSELKDFGVVFMGDSFTKGCFPYYVESNQSVAKYFASNVESPEQTFVSLCKSNVTMPHVVVLESVERAFVWRLSRLDFGDLPAIQPIGAAYFPPIKKQTDFSTFYRNQLINSHSVRCIQLRDSLFSCPQKEKELYFYVEDLQFPSDESVEIAVAKLDSLFQLANEKGVRLIYVVAADKYDVYQGFADDNPYQEKTVMEHFAKFESNPCFVNTKPLLTGKAMEGVKDLYYADDTHWSPVGAKIVADEIECRLDLLGVLQ